jgi:hypothetical protein
VAGTLSRLHLWGEDPANRFGDGVSRALLRRKWLTTMNAEDVGGPARQIASGALARGRGDICPAGDGV